MNRFLAGLLLAVATGGACAGDADEFRVKREEVYEFTRRLQ